MGVAWWKCSKGRVPLDKSKQNHTAKTVRGTETAADVLQGKMECIHRGPAATQWAGHGQWAVLGAARQAGLHACCCRELSWPSEYAVQPVCAMMQDISTPMPHTLCFRISSSWLTCCPMPEKHCDCRSWLPRLTSGAQQSKRRILMGYLHRSTSMTC